MEKKRKSLPLIELDEPERKCEPPLPQILEDILENMKLPEALNDMANEAVPEFSKDSEHWFLDYKGWRVIFGSEPQAVYKRHWINAIDQGFVGDERWDGLKFVVQKVDLDVAASINEEGRTLCECGAFGVCHAVRLVRRR